jgi:2-polyprenyl-3-methyl-5-hydroxy-6-metoxy-1,4-benzoquinol methylase
MPLKDEIKTYDRISPTDSGEIEIFDKIIFPSLIRKREIEIILTLVEKINPQRILDFGCGGGWLSKILTSRGYKVVGTDINETLLVSAKKITPRSEFVISDNTRLPIKGNMFDLIIGIAILHHLNIHKALVECCNVLRDEGYVLFMEPNTLNPFMAIGRRILPSAIHTEDERPISSGFFIRKLARIGFELKSVKYLFPYSFCISYLLRKIESNLIIRLAQLIYPLIKYSETVFERIPLLNKMGGVIVIIAKRGAC